MSKNDGFSFIEVLSTLLIVSVALLSLLAFQQANIKAYRQSLSHVSASSLIDNLYDYFIALTRAGIEIDSTHFSNQFLGSSQCQLTQACHNEFCALEQQATFIINQSSCLVSQIHPDARLVLNCHTGGLTTSRCGTGSVLRIGLYWPTNFVESEECDVSMFRPQQCIERQIIL